MLYLHTVLLAASLASLAPAQTDWYVDGASTQCVAANGTQAAPFCTIGQAVGAASSGDTIHIAPGTYFEHLSTGKGLTFVGTDGAATTILDGGGSGPPILKVSGEANTVIRGLTFQNGTGAFGGAIGIPGGVLQTSTVLIDSCVIQDNSATNTSTTATGGGIAVSRADVTVLDTAILRNVARGPLSGTGPLAEGGGLDVIHGDLTMERCLVANNNVDTPGISYGGGVLCLLGTLVVTDTQFIDNATSFGSATQGGGLYFSVNFPTNPATIERSTFRGNVANDTGGALQLVGTSTLEDVELVDNFTLGQGSALSTLGPCVVRRSTIVGDQSPSLIHVGASASLSMTSSIVWSYSPTIPIEGDPTSLAASTLDDCDVRGDWSGAGSGNIASDPLFADRANGDYTLLAGSPCIDAGDPAFTSTGLDVAGLPRFLDGNLDRSLRVDMGAHEFSNVLLSISGTATPGGSIAADITGTPGFTTYLVVGQPNPAGHLLSPWGSAFFQLGPSAVVVSMGTSPSSMNFPIPMSLAVPFDVTFQAIGFGPALPSGKHPGNFSNPITTTFE